MDNSASLCDIIPGRSSKEAIEQVYNGTKEPEQALDEAAAKSAKVLGW